MTAQDSRTRQTECDLLVVGSGAGGLSAANTAAWHGLRVVVVEKDRVWHLFDLATRRQGTQLVNGPALIARLLKSADDLGVELWVSSLAPIAKPPFHAIKVLPGSFGTFAGLRTDAHARVLNAAGDPVPGLYAVGCDQARLAIRLMRGSDAAGGLASWARSALTCYRLMPRRGAGPDQPAGRAYPRPEQTSR